MTQVPWNLDLKWDVQKEKACVSIVPSFHLTEFKYNRAVPKDALSTVRILSLISRAFSDKSEGIIKASSEPIDHLDASEAGDRSVL